MPSHQSRIIGTVLGAAIGDAMGHPTEFLPSMHAIHDRYGPKGVQGFELWWERDGARFSPYTDDTQMAEAVFRALLEGHGRDLDATMNAMAARFVEWSRNPQGGHRAPGNACMAGCRALERGAPWSEAGGPTDGGCGSVMRVYPFALMFADDAERAEDWAVAHSKLTHRDPIALAACAAMVHAVRLNLEDAPPDHVVTTMARAARKYSPTTADMIERAVDDAASGVAPDVTLDRLRGWAAHEAIAAAAYVYARQHHDPIAAILEGANTPGDSDSIATLAGALVGARHGEEGLPADWRRDVERSVELRDLAVECVVTLNGQPAG